MNRLKRGITEIITNYNKESKAAKVIITSLLVTSLLGIVLEALGWMHNKIVSIGYTAAIVVFCTAFICECSIGIIKDNNLKKK